MRFSVSGTNPNSDSPPVWGRPLFLVPLKGWYFCETTIYTRDGNPLREEGLSVEGVGESLERGDFGYHQRTPCPCVSSLGRGWMWVLLTSWRVEWDPQAACSPHPAVNHGLPTSFSGRHNFRKKHFVLSQDQCLCPGAGRGPAAWPKGLQAALHIDLLR